MLFVFSFVMKSTAVGIANPMNYLIAGIIIMVNLVVIGFRMVRGYRAALALSTPGSVES